MYICTYYYISTYVLLKGTMQVSTNGRSYPYITYIRMHITFTQHAFACWYVHVRMYVCMYVCMYACMYTCTNTQKGTHTVHPSPLGFSSVPWLKYLIYPAGPSTPQAFPRGRRSGRLFLSCHKASQPNNIEPCAHLSHLAH